jgi:ribosomal protein L29
LREVKELRELSDEELAKKVDEYKAELRRLRQRLVRRIMR